MSNEDGYDIPEDDSELESSTIESPAVDRDNYLDDGEYIPPSQLDLPAELIESLLEKGYKYKWVHRNLKTIRKRLNRNEGYSFLRPSELTPEQLAMSGDTEKDGISGDLITNGDLVLMKVRIERNEARRNYYRGKTKAQSDAIKQRLLDQDIDSTSKSVVRTGKNAHFRS